MMRPVLPAAILAGCLTALPAWAQAPLTFEGAIATAQANSLAVVISQSKLVQSQRQIDQTYAGIFPQLSLSSNAESYRTLDGNTMLGGFGGGLGSTIGVPITVNMVQNSLTLSQILFDGFQVSAGLKMAQASVRINELDRDNQRRLAGYNAANAYLSVLRASALRAVALQSLDQAQSHLSAATAREHAGTGTRFDVLQAEGQVASVQGSLRGTTNSVDLARLSLANTLGEPLGDRPLSSEVILPSVAFDPQADLTPAMEHRTELLSLQAKRRIDEANLDLNRNANYPKAQAQAQYSQQGLGTGRSLVFLAGLSWTALDWGKASAKAHSSEEDLRQTDLNLELVRRNLSMDIQGAMLSRQDARDRLSIAAKGLQVSQEAMRMAQVRYNAGVGTGFEVIDAQTQQAMANNTYVQAQFDLQAAEIRLAQALGVDLAAMVTLAKRS